ncbi:MAG: transcriptional repressor LexA [Planctomycetota bacterium]
MNYTPKQLRILQLIYKHQQEYGYSPTYAELAKELGISTITVFEHLETLERKNAIRRRRHEARSIEIIEQNFLREQNSLKSLPIKGVIAAGAPIEAIAISTSEEIPIADVFHCKPNSFLLRVKDHSMIDDHIIAGDLLVMEARNTADNGEIVIALDDHGRATLKRFYRENDKIRLQSLHSAHSFIIVNHCEIHGVFKGLVRRV